MVPLAAVTKFESRPGPEFTMRFNDTALPKSTAPRLPVTAPPGHGGLWKEVFRAKPCARNGLRLPGHVVPGEKKRRKEFPCSAVSLLCLVLVPDFAALIREFGRFLQRPARTPVRGSFGAFFVLCCAACLLSAFLPSYMVQIESDVYSNRLVMLIGFSPQKRHSSSV